MHSPNVMKIYDGGVRHLSLRQRFDKSGCGDNLLCMNGESSAKLELEHYLVWPTIEWLRNNPTGFVIFRVKWCGTNDRWMDFVRYWDNMIAKNGGEVTSDVESSTAKFWRINSVPLIDMAQGKIIIESATQGFRGIQLGGY